MAMKQITVNLIATIPTTGASLISQTLEIYATIHTIMKCFNSSKNAGNIVLKRLLKCFADKTALQTGKKHVSHTSIVPTLFTHFFFILGKLSLVIFVFIHGSFVAEYLHAC